MRRQARLAMPSFSAARNSGDRERSVCAATLAWTCCNGVRSSSVSAQGGSSEMVERNCRVARLMAERLAAEPGISLVCPVMLNQFMIRFEAAEGNGDALTLATVEQVQADAIAFIGSSQWRGRWVMRVSVSSVATTEEDGEVAAAAVIDAWRRVMGERR